MSETGNSLMGRPPSTNGRVSMAPRNADPAARRTPGRRYPTTTTVQLAGMALHNTTMAGPSGPARPQIYQPPEGAPPSVTGPDNPTELAAMAATYAAEAVAALQQAKGNARDEAAAAGRKKKIPGVLRHTGRLLAKVARHSGRALGLVQPPVPTWTSVLQVGRDTPSRTGSHGKLQDSGIADRLAWQGQAQQLQQRRTQAAAQTVQATYTLRKVEAAASAVEQLHAQIREVQGPDPLGDGLTGHVAERLRLHEQQAQAEARQAEAEARVVQQFLRLENALDAQAQAAESREHLLQQHRLLLERQCAVQPDPLASSAGSHVSAAAPTLRAQTDRARRELSALTEELADLAQRTADARVAAQAQRVQAELDREPATSPSAQQWMGEVCRLELQAARKSLQMLEARPGAFPAPAADLEQARADVAGLENWRQELDEADLGGRARDAVNGATLRGRGDDAADLEQRRADVRQRWTSAAAALARLEAMHPELAASEAGAQGHRTWQDLGRMRGRLGKMDADLAQARSRRHACEQALDAALDVLRQTHSDVAQAKAARQQYAAQWQVGLEASDQSATALAQATQAKTSATDQATDLQGMMSTLCNATAVLQTGSMSALLAAPPGFESPAVKPLRDVLQTLAARLLAQAQAQARSSRMAPDAMLEMVIRLAAHQYGGDGGAAAQALAALAEVGIEDLVAQPGPDGSLRKLSPLAMLASPLAQEICALPRGASILQALTRPAATPLDASRLAAVHVYQRATTALASADAADLDWLQLAQAGAATRVHGTTPGDPAQHSQTVAFNGVRNGLTSRQAGSAYAQVDRYMRSMTQSLSDGTGAGSSGIAARTIGRLLPIGKPTPFNQTALKAAGKAAAAVGIVDRVADALGEVAAAADALHAEWPPAADALPALRTVAGAVRSGTATAEADTCLATLAAEVRHLLDEPGPPDTAKPAVQRLAQALVRAEAARVMAAPRIRGIDDAAGFFDALLSNFQLRDKLKMTGGKIFGATTSGLVATENFIPGPVVQGRADLRLTRQKDTVLDLILAPQAIQLTIGGQTTDVARGGGGGSVGVGLPFIEKMMVRPVDLEWRTTREVQAQTGVLLRVPRTNSTEAADMAGFKLAMADILQWDKLRRPDGRPYEGPLEMVLARHPQLSINLLGEYDRRTVRNETNLSSGAAFRLPGMALSGGLTAGSRSVATTTRGIEDSGYFQFQERKRLVQVIRQRGVGAGASVRLLGGPRREAEPSASGLRLQAMQDSKTRGVEKIFRLTTTDGVLEPNMCRYTIEYAGKARFLADVRAHWHDWVMRGVQYAAYPADWPEHAKFQEAERELKLYLAEVEATYNEFMVLQVVHAIHAEVAPEVDAARGLVDVAKRCGDAAEVARREAALDRLLADPNTWMIGRLVMAERSNRTEQTGLALGVVAQGSSVADASHAVLTFPAHPRI